MKNSTTTHTYTYTSTFVNREKGSNVKHTFDITEIYFDGADENDTRWGEAEIERAIYAWNEFNNSNTTIEHKILWGSKFTKVSKGVYEVKNYYDDTLVSIYIIIKR